MVELTYPSVQSTTWIISSRSLSHLAMRGTERKFDVYIDSWRSCWYGRMGHTTPEEGSCLIFAMNRSIHDRRYTGCYGIPLSPCNASVLFLSGITLYKTERWTCPTPGFIFVPQPSVSFLVSTSSARSLSFA